MARNLFGAEGAFPQATGDPDYDEDADRLDNPIHAFDLIIADECHRSIYGAWQTALTHFDALNVGLTATPPAYIERNTFQFYQCRDGQPDFAFPIQQAFQDGYLVPYKFATGITVILAEGAEVDETTYDPAEFERRWTNEDSNRKMMEEFDRLAWENYKELAPGQKTGSGKAIVFKNKNNHPPFVHCWDTVVLGRILKFSDMVCIRSIPQ